MRLSKLYKKVSIFKVCIEADLEPREENSRVVLVFKIHVLIDDLFSYGAELTKAEMVR